LTDSNLFSGHTTWSTFSDMLRSWKMYTFNLGDESVMSATMSFSGYPGILTSVDDFFVTSSGLTVMETTNGVNNASLYQYITPQSVLSWIRTIVSNRMAGDAQNWTIIFSMYNSGTYNNQWMVVDNSLYPGSMEALPNNTFWILEQIPGYVESADMTWFINEKGFWPSYNIPYFKYIFDISGFPLWVQQYGNWFSYQECPRCLIFGRDHNNVNDMNSMKWIMRYNDWQTDPLSQGNSGNAIASRFDLVNTTVVPNPWLVKAAFGGIDSKVTSARDAMKVIAQGVSGPTWDQQPVFSWAPWSNVTHLGMPEEFGFDWHKFDPADFN